MPEENGDYRKIIRDLVEAARQNAEEHERIWKAIAVTNANVDRVGAGVDRLVTAIRDLIDRIPPENLR